MKVNNAVKIVALLLALQLIAGCANPESVNNNDTVGESEYVFVNTGITNVFFMSANKEHLYLMCGDYDADNREYKENNYFDVLDSKLNTICQLVYTPYIEGNIIFKFAVTPDGGYWTVEGPIIAGAEESYLRYFSNDGKEQLTIEMFEAYGEDLILRGTDNEGRAILSNSAPMGYNNLLDLLLISQNGEIVTRWDGLFPDGLSVAALDDGRLLLLQWRPNTLYELTRDGKAKLLHTLNDKQYNDLWAGEGNTVYLSENQNLYKLSLDTMEIELMMNWSKNIPGAPISDVSLLSGGELYAVLHLQLVCIEHKNTQIIVEDDRQIINVATYRPEEAFRTAIFDFNASSKTHRLEVTDYSQYDTEVGSGAMLRLNLDIAAGRIPDLFLWGRISNTSGFDLTPYLNKGLFADMREFLDKDPKFSLESFVPSVINAVIASDGGLYELPFEFAANAVACSRSAIGLEQWTFDEFYREIEKYAEAKTVFGPGMTKEVMLFQLLNNNWDEYIDWQTGVCNFESDSFLRMLEFCVAQECTDMSMLAADAIAEGIQLLYYNTISDVSSIQKFTALFQDDVTFIGFPASKGRGNAIRLTQSVSIYDGSPHKEACWEFVREFYDKEYQLGPGRFLPTNAEALEERLAHPEDYEEAGVTLMYTNAMTGKTWSVTFTDATEAESAQLRELIESLDRIFRVNTSLYDIVMEEAAPFFAGDKSAEETARIIQNRAQTYVSEQSG